jgi:hypothetical protein
MRTRCVYFPWSISLLSIFLLSIAAVAPAHASPPTVASFALPSRDESPAAARSRHAAMLVAQRLRARLAPFTPPVDVHERVTRARRLMAQVALDEAATLLDGIIEEGARAPAQVSDPPSLIAAYVLRISIAVARGELERTRTLFARLLAYDPGFELLPDEDTPPMHAALMNARGQLGDVPKLDADDLGESCRATDVVIVGRMLRGEVELSRYDDCHLVAQTSESADDALVAALAVPRAELPAAVPRGRPSGRAKIIAGAVLAGVGVALTATGIYFAADAAARENGIGDDCAPCTAAQYQTRGSAFMGSEIAASVLLPIAAAALVSGTTLLIVGRRQEKQSPHLTLTPAGASIDFPGGF